MKATYSKKDTWHTAVHRITTEMKGACLPIICSEDVPYTAVFAGAKFIRYFSLYFLVLPY